MKFVRRGGLAILLAVACTYGAFAAEVPELYTAQVALDESSRDPRQEAYRAALMEVLVRVSGAEVREHGARIEELFPDPAAYVTQFRPGENETLWVSFDGAALEQVMRGAGFTVWGGDRPLTLVWLAVDWGQGRREIVSAEASEQTGNRSRSIDRNRLLRERLTDVAAKRGLPIAFPLLDTIDRQAVTFSDIWGGFDERVRAASERYDVRSVLIGRVRPASGDPNRWRYFFGSEQRSWSGSPENAMGQIAGLMAAEFSVGGAAPLEQIVLRVSGIESVDAYGKLQGMLGDVAMIESLQVSAVSGDTVSYDVNIRGSAERLRRALRFAGLVEQERFAVPAEPDRFGAYSQTLEFFFSR